MDLVIARFNEELDWVNQVQADRVFIYNKGSHLQGSHPLINIGREASSYVYHIIKNYHNLGEYTCFLQGDPKPHLDIDICQIRPIGVDFQPLGYTLISDLNGSHHPLDIENLFLKEFFTIYPLRLVFTAGAQFIVSREAILKHSENFYCRIFNMFFREGMPERFAANGENCLPWILERCWGVIFGNFLTK